MTAARSLAPSTIAVLAFVGACSSSDGPPAEPAAASGAAGDASAETSIDAPSEAAAEGGLGADGDAGSGADGAAGGPDGPPKGHAKILPFAYSRPDKGQPVPQADVAAITDRYLDLLSKTRYFDFVDERAHGWPESDPKKRYWYATWWSGAGVEKSGGAITYRHVNVGADNNGIRTSPLLEGSCWSWLLWQKARTGKLVRRLVRGFDSWILAMQRKTNDPAGTLLTRAFYPVPVQVTDGPRSFFIDYAPDRPGIDNGATDYVHIPSNPIWGDIWVKNKRSKDDIGHMLRAIGDVDACDGRLADAAGEQELDAMWAAYASWARRVEDDGWAIATFDKNGELWIPPDLLAHFVSIGNAECTAMLAIRLLGRGDPGALACGNGIGPFDELISSANDHNAEILRSFHEAAAVLAILYGHYDLGRALLEGLAKRMEEALDAIEAGTPLKYVTDESLAALIVHAAAVGVPLTSREVRFLHARIDEAVASFPNQPPGYYDVFAQSTPDGAYAFAPDGKGIGFERLGALLGLCAAQYRNPLSKPALDCAKVKAAK